MSYFARHRQPKLPRLPAGRTRPVPFDPDLGQTVVIMNGVPVERCPGCTQPNHTPGDRRWREIGGGVHFDSSFVRRARDERVAQEEVMSS